MREPGALNDWANARRATSRIPDRSIVAIVGEAFGRIWIGKERVGPQRWIRARYQAPDDQLHEGWMYPENFWYLPPGLTRLN